ncbi:spondin domain-containing protein [Nostoc sp. CHAB 5844]|nr:spondin domain-containing protein [Nostoc sp. CHAB 5844]
MNSHKYRNLKATLIGLSATLAIASNPATAQAATFQVSVENLAPQYGQALAPVWFGFHDGRFDPFQAGQAAPVYIEHVAENGFTGDAHGRIPADFFTDLAAAGTDFSRFPSPPDSIAGTFAASESGQNGGYQDIVFSNRRGDPYFAAHIPGETLTTRFNVDLDANRNRFFSYAGMVGWSNDAFIGNDNAIEVFDAQGNFIGADFVVLGNQVWDAGTEVNDEDYVHVPFAARNLFTGIAETNVVRRHSGLRPPGTGGIVDFQFNGEGITANADFTAPGYQIARIKVTRVPEAGTTTGLLALGGLLLLGRSWRRKQSIEC